MTGRGRYTVHGQIGQGGMATVHRVTDTTDDRLLALKRLDIGEVVDSKRKRAQGLFEREYHTLAQLAHPRIIEVYDYGIDEVGPYYTMELLDGDDLKHQSPLPWRRTCELLRDVSSSLAIVHARGLLHRDVTPSNVRCTADGRAKLIDFGAMCAMGVATDLVGTPPFVPPELLQQGTLDGRTDLFALGATAYYVLTGRHAYPARSMRQLRDVWRSLPQPPDQLVPEIPAALSQLVLQMLSLSPVGRPTSAAIVFERLTGIADLPRDEVIDVARAYLVAPSLSGRGEPLAQGRRRFLRALRGHGTALVVTGAAGVGRSRMLDALLLEAKLIGAEVSRADAGDARMGELGVMQRLIDNLIKVRPELAELDASEDFAWFAQRLDVPLTLADLQERRGRVIAAIAAWLTDAAGRCPITLAVDDAHEIDAASLSCLASVVGRLKRRRLCVMLSVDAAASGDAAQTLAVLREHALTLPLEPLDEDNSERMIASIFGDVPNVQLLAGILFRTCRGYPALNMAVAQHMVDAGVIRYEGGGWILPALAGTIEAALPRDEPVSERLAALSAPARHVAALLALDVDAALDLSDLARLSEPLTGAEVHRALDELIGARILTPHGATYRFPRAEQAREVADALAEDVARDLHDRIAQVLRPGPEAAVARARHQLAGGQVGAACDTLLSVEQRRYVTNSGSLDLMEAVLAAGDAGGTHPGKLSKLRVRAAVLAFEQNYHERVATHAPRALADLAEQCGLGDHARLADAPPEQRLQRALQLAVERHQAAPDMSFHPFEAIQLLSLVSIGLANTAWAMVDGDLNQHIPSMEPLLPLSPALGVVERLVAALTTQCVGAGYKALHEFVRLDTELQAPQPGMEAEMHRTLSLTARAYRQGYEALLGCEGMLERTKDTQAIDPKRAEGERLAYYLAMGDVEAAAQARRRMELLQIQRGFTRHETSFWMNEVALQLVCADVQGLQQSWEMARECARTRPRWTTRVRLCEAMHYSACGAFDDARASLDALLEDLPVRHPDYCMTVSALLAVECELQRFERAAELGEKVVAEVRGLNVIVPACVYTSYALARLGRHQESAHYQHIAREELDAERIRGVLRGQFHEWAARCALLRRDAAAFREHAMACAQQYRTGHNPLLTARYEGLMQQALADELPVAPGLQDAAELSSRTSVSHMADQLHTELSQLTDQATRYDRALLMLIERFGAAGGYLYLSTHEGLRRVARAGDLSDGDVLDDKIVTYWKSETADQVTHTATAAADELAQSADDGQGIRHGEWLLRPFLLTDMSDGRAVASGVVVLAESEDACLEVSWNALEAAARVMRVQTLVVTTNLS